jgi:cold shock CspA family protein
MNAEGPVSGTKSQTGREWGVLKFFNTSRGYGIIVEPRGDVFLGLGAVTRAGIDPWLLQAGVRLEYDRSPTSGMSGAAGRRACA